MFLIPFLLGIAGSLHCIGMCGPIALSLPMATRSKNGRFAGALLYNAGRIVTYTWLGLVLGMAGRFLITPVLQQTLSLLFGVLILTFLVLPQKWKLQLTHIKPLQKGFLQLRTALARLFTIQTNSSLFGIGILNGLLPCGMIYMALSASFLTGSAWKGSLFMLAYGAGTLPAMAGMAYFGAFFKQVAKARLRRTVPVFLFIMGSLLILRGLNLGIPYVSPSLPASSTAPVICH